MRVGLLVSAAFLALAACSGGGGAGNNATADVMHTSANQTRQISMDDKTVEKKDKTLNEPVQFLLSKATQPYELVVNDIKKDLISGYVASPKVQQTRN